MKRALALAGLARPAPTLLVGVFLAVLTWRDVNLPPTAGLDPSWHAALHMAARHRMRFGNSMVFSFGPLGFLTQPTLYYASTGLLSALYVFGLQVALCAALVSVLRRTMPLPAAAVVTFVLAGAARELKAAEVVVVVVVLVAIGLLRGDHPRRVERSLVVAGGVVAGAHVLVKFNTGLTVAMVGAATAWFVGRRAWRSEAVFLGSAAAALLAGWVATENTLADLGPFLHNSLQVASGYSETMGIELHERWPFYPLAALVTAVVVAAGWVVSREWSRGRRLGLALVGTAWLYAGLKHGFVRHDEHDVVFFGEALLVGTAIAAGAAASLSGARRWLPAAAAAGMLLVYVLAAAIGLGALVDPLPSLRHAGGDALTFASTGRRARIVESARAAMRQSYGLEPATLVLLDGHTVHVRPWEAAVAWAYPEFRWRPVPVFQEYSAYTAGLDRLDADFLAGPSAPERILTEEASIDFRNPDWESPSVEVTLLCHYRELGRQPGWQVLGRVEDRCGAEEPLGTVEADIGGTVAVPDTGGRDVIVIARIQGLDSSPLYGLRATLLRIPAVHVTLDGHRRYRLVPGTAADGLVVRAPGAILGFSKPFAPASATSLTVQHRGGIGLGTHLRVEFVAVPVLN